MLQVRTEDLGPGQGEDGVRMSWGWVGIVWGIGSGELGMTFVVGNGGRRYNLFTFRLHFGSILEVFGWILAAPGFRLGSDWVQIGHHGSKVEYWELLLVPPGSTLGGLGSSLIPFGGRLVSLWVPRASKIDAVGNQADTATTCENNWF